MTKLYDIPPIKINGIKSKLLPFIQSNLPHDYKKNTWIEPFMGSGVVGFNFAGIHAQFADINPHIIKFYTDLQNDNITPYELKSYLAEQSIYTIKNPDHYYIIRDRFNKNPNSYDFLYLSRMCFNGIMRFNQQNKFNVPFSKNENRLTTKYITTLCEQIHKIQFKIQNNNWKFKVATFDEIIPTANKNDFIYCDPPYTGLNTNYYGNWKIENDQQMFQLLQQTQCNWMISNWKQRGQKINPLLETLYKDQIIKTQQHTYIVGGTKEKRPSITEVLIMNYR